MRPSHVNPIIRRAGTHSSPRPLAVALRRLVAVLATGRSAWALSRPHPLSRSRKFPYLPPPPRRHRARSLVRGPRVADPHLGARRGRADRVVDSRESLGDQNGETTLDLFAQPVFKRNADGWSSIDSTITAGTGELPVRGSGPGEPGALWTTADALVTIDTVSGPVMFGLQGATVNAPTLTDGVVTYAGYSQASTWSSAPRAAASASTWCWPTLGPSPTSGSPSQTQGTP